MNKQTIALRQWRVDCGREPVVRIGVVLAEDAMRAIEMRLPDAPYDLASADGGGRTVRAATISASLDSDAVAVAVDHGTPQRAGAWTLTPQQPGPLKKGAGILVRDVVAGRGFHWQKHVDQTLAGTVQLLPAPGGLVLVNELPLEAYLAGVITAEMSSHCPAEFLRAQCITARSWLLAFTEPKHRGQPFDRCNDDCCQRYQGTGDMSDVAVDAAESTRGLVLVADGAKKVVDANYSKSCGGIVELPEHVWGVHKPGLGPQVDAPAESTARRFTPVTDANLDEYLDGDWLRSTDIYCSAHVVPEDELPKYLGRVDEAGRYFRWTVKYSHDELLDLLRRKLPEAAEMTRVNDLKVTQRGVSGRAIEIVLDMSDKAGQNRQLTVRDQYRIRQILHSSFLFSSAFAARIQRDAGGSCKTLTLRGAGWGHGAGLCQIGALGMALCKIDHAEIVKHYFPDAELKRLYGG